MGRIISIVNQKGGVGKSTTAMNLAAYLSHYGRFVCVIDLDPQANATSGLGINPEELSATVYHALSGTHSLRDIAVETGHEGFRLIPSSSDTAGANIELVNEDRREFRLRDKILEISNDYDYVIIDSPPSLGLLTINGLVAADEILVPVQAEYYALEGLGQLLKTIGLIKEHLRPDIDVLGAVLTMYDKRNKLAGGVLTDIQQYFPHRVFRSVIPRNVRLAEAPSYGQTILHYDPGSKGARAYEGLSQEIIETENYD